jgi:hypothetical protein
MTLSQISTREVAAPKKVEKTIKFDSTSFYDYHTMAYIGQKIQVKPSLSSSESHRFINLSGTEEFDIKPYYNKFLIVTGVSDFNYRKFYDLNYFDSPALILSDIETKTPICLLAHNSMESTYHPIIPISFYNYLLSDFLNKRVYVCPFCIREHDVNTGEKIPNIESQKWTCIDIQFRKRSYGEGHDLVLFIQSEEGYTSDIEANYLDRMWHSEGRKRIFSNKEWIKYGKKYGYDTMRNVLRGKIQIGMPRELLYMAWGFPDEINQLSSDVFQLVYYDQYVYIKYRNEEDAYVIEFN